MIKASTRLESHKPLWRRYRWLIGVSLACWVNTSLDIVAFALAPLALIAPIGGLTIVVSVLLARAGFAGEREQVSNPQWVAIGAVIGGVAVVDMYGPHPEPDFNTSVVFEHFHNDGFVAYQLLALAVVVFAYAGLCLGKLGGHNIKTTLTSAVAGGLCSGITQTMMKVMSMCAAASALNGDLPFLIPEFWIALAELSLVAIVLIHMLNLCLSSANLAIATPLYQVSVIIFTIVASCAFYGDLSVATQSELMMFILGVVAVLSGLGVLIFKREKNEKLLPTYEKSNDPKPAPTAEPHEPHTAPMHVELALVDELPSIEMPADDPNPEP